VKGSLPAFEQKLLLFSVFVISLCGITYELVLGSLATYLLGNPVQQYSITIGFFLSSMGAGSFISRYITKDLVRNFVLIEVYLGLIGGLSVLILTYMFSFSTSYYLLHIFFLLVIGAMVGLEIPLLTRIMKEYGSLKDILSNVLSLDYIGGLAGSLLFPLVLFPFVGRFLTSIVIGLVNASVALSLVWLVKYPGRKKSDLILLGVAATSDQMNHLIQKKLYYDDIVFSKRSKYQEIVLTRNADDFRLYLDGSLQFSTFDEYRYHEMLVFPAVLHNPNKKLEVLILGGGDGLALRDALKCGRVSRAVLVELDQAIISLARNNPTFRRINAESLSDKRAEVIVGDAYDYIRKGTGLFDIIIADFPDPHDETISKLYTAEFFSMIKRRLKGDGFFITQSTSPLFAKEAFWCIYNTMKKVFPIVIPYHAYVPTFGDWGFNMASTKPFKSNTDNLRGIKPRFFSKETFDNSLHFQSDSRKIDTVINTFNRPVLYTYYLKGWKYMDL
jgi:spermidine synthase